MATTGSIYKMIEYYNVKAMQPVIYTNDLWLYGYLRNHTIDGFSNYSVVDLIFILTLTRLNFLFY